MNKRVLIVGGGPSGAVAGIYLLKHGFNVTLFEKGNKKRNKTCGEGLTPESQHILDQIGMLNTVKKYAYSIDEMKLFDLSNNPISLKNQYYTLERSMLDSILRDEIETLEGKIIYNTTISDWKTTDDSVWVKTRSGQIYKGDMLILATGAENSLIKNSNLVATSYSAVALRAYGENTIGCNSLEFYLHKKLFPAYGWVFPLPGNRINIGVYTHKDTGPTRDLTKLMNIFYEVLSERYSKPIKIIDPLQGWILQTGLNSKNIVDDRVLLVGENIACTYNFSGEGIGPAMKSGLLAAETITEAEGDYSKDTLSQYEYKITAILGPMHRGYNNLMRIFKYKVFFKIATWFLRHSTRVKVLTENVIDEKISLEQALSFKQLILLLRS